MSNRPTRTDADLLRLHTDGDEDAFGVLYQRHHGKLRAAAARIAGLQDAEDALQEGMIKAYRQAHQFMGRSTVSTWLYRIVVNAAHDLVRTRRPVIDSSNYSEPSCEPRGILQAERRMDIKRYWTRLTPGQRTAIGLIDLMDYSVGEAAKITGVPEGTLKVRAARGRAILRPLFPRSDNHPTVRAALGCIS